MEPEARTCPAQAAALGGGAAFGLSRRALQPDWCPSQRCAHRLIGLAVAVVVADFAVCYALWLGHGCMAFLPFISDLGLHGAMKATFVVGLVTASLLMLGAFPHILVARLRLLRALRLSRSWHVLNWLVAAAGIATAFGAGTLGFLPWDRFLYQHLVCANIIFGGGGAWAAGSWLLAQRFAAAARETWSSCPRVRRLQLLVALACAADVAFVALCAGAAVASEPEKFEQGGVAEMLRLANRDFGAYCTGQQAWHAIGWINCVALGEWLFIALLIVGFAAAGADLEAYCCVQRSMAALPVHATGEDLAEQSAQVGTMP